eukprot:366082-Chlamydomonas_euryale.AAC.9
MRPARYSAAPENDGERRGKGAEGFGRLAMRWGFWAACNERGGVRQGVLRNAGVPSYDRRTLGGQGGLRLGARGAAGTAAGACA